MLNTKFSPWPSYTEEEVKAVSEVLYSNKVNYWTGNICREFEKEFAAWADSKFAITLANGTVALDLALKALDIGEGDEVITTPRTFLATASSIVTTGAVPIFADVDLNSQNIEASSIESVLTPNTKAIIVVHLAGMPAEMEQIMELSRKHGFYVIEDCAQAHGARYKGRSVGSIGHIGAWSFCQDKIMTTGGEGGMVTTNSKVLWEKMWSYKDHGKNFDKIYNSKSDHKPGFRWLHDSFGTNWRMTEIQACIGLVQLKRMKEWTLLRNRNANIIAAALEDLPAIRSVVVPQYVQHAYYKQYMFINTDKLKVSWNRDKIIHKCTELGVPIFQGSCSEVYLEKAFEGKNWLPQNLLKNAVALGETSLMFLVHPTLTESEMKVISKIVRNVIVESSITS
ncbi:putative PLP-dependent enzyme [Shewanella psychrophila]|uniref:Putative PLP-dependent enzyme n=1 Tax=Shewanella psychrophila TaxID=225848 RepID=A0A1S6HTM3_9GAMM|nr:DegT/DnrJ/EryC1/StrS aminotransferase family protein [Shewanella psychrophila]AQS38831.1 putative PLP-dependent enzyme [Shewanella psychrophila]